MYPNLLGFDDSSYLLFIVIGIIASLVVAFLYFKKIGYSKREYIDLLICSLFAIAGGLVFALLFENLYELIQDPSTYKFHFGFTFIGGLFGGVITFLLVYHLAIKKETKMSIKELLIMAPGAITIAHAFGRIGCFFAGCCYGVKTDSFIGIDFPDIGKRVPTQLIESIFLFILCALLIYLAFKKHYKYSFVIYAISYSVFRFIIEFFRDDPRGGFIGPFSPSQIWCLIILIGVYPLILVINRIFKNQDE